MEILSYGMVVLRGLASLWLGFTLDWVEEEDERILSDMCGVALQTDAAVRVLGFEYPFVKPTFVVAG